jgi:hypothetical protein
VLRHDALHVLQPQAQLEELAAQICLDSTEGIRSR